MAAEITVPGFRKGKAPFEKALERISQEHLIEHTLGHLLPKRFTDAIIEHKIKPAMYPKFELVSAEEGKDWQVRAVTVELPEVKLGDYKAALIGEARAEKIWTPEKGSAKAAQKEKELTQEEKEAKVIDTLLEKIEINVPKMLVEEEINSRLSSLLERLEKLGLSLESYLASINKTGDSLRSEYRDGAERSIKLDIILSEVAQKEKVEVTDEEMQAFISVASSDKDAIKRLTHNSQEAATVRALLKKRKVLEHLVSLLT